jgi:hypothetical protein
MFDELLQTARDLYLSMFMLYFDTRRQNATMQQQKYSSVERGYKFLSCSECWPI